VAKRKNKKNPKLRPTKEQEGGAKHGFYALTELLKGDLDGRLSIAKKRDRLEADLIDHCGGVRNLSPPLISLIKRITHKEIIAQHAEKMALIGQFDLAEKRYLALSNSLRLDIMALQQLLASNRGRGRIPTIEEILAEYQNEKDDDN